MKKTLLSLLCVLGLVSSAAFAADDAKSFIGNWALTIPGGGSGWLGVEEKDGGLKGSLLWGGGSVLPVAGVKVEDGKLIVTRIQQAKGKDGKPGPKITETITGTRDGDCLKLVTVKCGENGKEFGRAEFTGKFTPPVSAAPRNTLNSDCFARSVSSVNSMPKRRSGASWPKRSIASS